MSVKYNGGKDMLITRRFGMGGLRRAFAAALLLGAGLGLFVLGVSFAAAADLAGFYEGTFTGGDQGPWKVGINETGTVAGKLYSTEDVFWYSVNGNVTDSGEFSAVVGSATSGATFKGNITAKGALTGTWSNRIWHLTGEFTGKRIELLQTTRENKIIAVKVDPTVTTFTACRLSWTLEEGGARISTLRGDTLSADGALGVTFVYHQKLSPYRLVIGYFINNPNKTYTLGGRVSTVRNHEFGHVFQIVTNQKPPITPQERKIWDINAQKYGSWLTSRFGISVDITIQVAINYLLTRDTCRKRTAPDLFGAYTGSGRV
jgi:hypothetical protein